MEIKTVGELRKLLRCCEDEEPILYQLKTCCGDRYLECSGASSTAGGRAVVLWLDPQGTQKKKQKKEKKNESDSI